MHIKHFYDHETATFTYILIDEKTKKSAIIDSVLNYDKSSSQTRTISADQLINYVKKNKLQNEWILETHIHADHITASHYLKKHIGGKIAMGSGIKEVLDLWVPKYDTLKNASKTGDQFDCLFDDNQTIELGSLRVKIWHTKGHTPSCVTYLAEEAAFIGDTLFRPDLGTARCDFPGGSADQLYETIQRLYSLSDETKLYLCHDYPNETDEPQYCILLKDQKTHNKMISQATLKADFIKRRTDRDKTLQVPKLLDPAIQANICLGDFTSLY